MEQSIDIYPLFELDSLYDPPPPTHTPPHTPGDWSVWFIDNIELVVFAFLL